MLAAAGLTTQRGGTTCPLFLPSPSSYLVFLAYNPVNTEALVFGGGFFFFFFPEKPKRISERFEAWFVCGLCLGESLF